MTELASFENGKQLPFRLLERQTKKNTFSNITLPVEVISIIKQQETINRHDMTLRFPRLVDREYIWADKMFVNFSYIGQQKNW